MQANGARSTTRKSRADGQRNRAAIMLEARRMFMEKGAGVTLDEIARAAGVGNGTLYRHFPTRDALIEAVCHDDARELIEAAARFAAGYPPAEALLRWLDVFIDHVAERNIVAEAVAALVSVPRDSSETTGDEVREALIDLYRRAELVGELEASFDTLDLLRVIAGVGTVCPATAWPDQAKRLVRAIIIGSRQLPPAV